MNCSSSWCIPCTCRVFFWNSELVSRSKHTFEISVEPPFLCESFCVWVFNAALPPFIVRNQFSDWFLTFFSAFSASGFVLAPLRWIFSFFVHFFTLRGSSRSLYNFSLPTQNQPLAILRLAGQSTWYLLQLQPNSRDLLRIYDYFTLAKWLFHTRKRGNLFKYLCHFKCYLCVVVHNNNVILAKF